MGHWIELKPEGAGPIRAWRADPAGAPRGVGVARALIAAMAIWWLN